MLASANKYTNPVINSVSNITSTLIKLEFERHKAIKRNNRLLTGNEFVEHLTYTYHNGERIFAYVGRSHCAAFLPFRESDSSYRYKAQDTWDSTERKIGEYWVIPSKTTRDSEKLRQIQKTGARIEVSRKEFSIGDTFTHKNFGTGTVISKNDVFVEVDFPGVGIKKLSLDWITKSLNG